MLSRINVHVLLAHRQRRPLRGPQHSLMKHVLTDMQNAPAAWPFAKPVNKDEVADYYLLVQEPMGSASLSLSCYLE
jgi:histone acetyltransferase